MSLENLNNQNQTDGRMDCAGLYIGNGEMLSYESSGAHENNYARRRPWTMEEIGLIDPSISLELAQELARVGLKLAESQVEQENSD